MFTLPVIHPFTFGHAAPFRKTSVFVPEVDTRSILFGNACTIDYTLHCFTALADLVLI